MKVERDRPLPLLDLTFREVHRYPSNLNPAAGGTFQGVGSVLGGAVQCNDQGKLVEKELKCMAEEGVLASAPAAHPSHLAISTRQEFGAIPATFLDIRFEEVRILTHPPLSVL